MRLIRISSFGCDGCHAVGTARACHLQKARETEYAVECFRPISEDVVTPSAQRSFVQCGLFSQVLHPHARPYDGTRAPTMSDIGTRSHSHAAPG
jgi:hypothetical protein